MGNFLNCFKQDYNENKTNLEFNNEFNKELLEPLNENYINNTFNRLFENILNIEKKIYILEQNTQNNLKLLSDDIHHINKSVKNLINKTNTNILENNTSENNTSILENNTSENNTIISENTSENILIHFSN